MRGGIFRSWFAGLVIALVLHTNVPAGPLKEAIGKGWDKVAGKIVKAKESAKEHKHKGKLLEHKHAHAGAAACCQ